MSAQNITVIAGPTAGGKSALALRLAQERNGIVINADSMQIYDALPILTARPNGQDLSQAPHRLYGILPPHETCSAARWRALAVAEIEQSWAAEQQPIVVGGTGFYIKSLMEGLSPIPGIPETVRAETIALHAELGNPVFHAALAAIDPVMAARLHPNDTQRLIRAYEVMKATGQSLNDWQALPGQGAPARWRFNITLVMPDRKTLYDRCNTRFDAMMHGGALDEAANYTGPADAPVTHALGFRPLRDYLAGRIPLDDAIERAKAETRQYAKRQVTWFRHQIKPLSGNES